MRQGSLDRLEASYQDMIDYLNSLYDQYPTALIHIPLSDQEKADMAYWDALGEVTSKPSLAAGHSQPTRHDSGRSKPRDIRYPWLKHRG